MSGRRPRVALAAVLALAIAGGEACTAATREGAGPALPAVPEGIDAAAAQATVARFAGALEAGRFEEAHALLSARWRERYTAAQLATDWRGAGGIAREAARRARAATPRSVRLAGDRARVDVGEGRSALLVAEERGWRVDALE